MYRLLFCFYAEARGGELQILPTDDNIYRLGYSLESLRDLEQVPLTAATEEGSYFHEHLKRLFAVIHDGFNPHENVDNNSQMAFGWQAESVRAFHVRPLIRRTMTWQCGFQHETPNFIIRIFQRKM